MISIKKFVISIFILLGLSIFLSIENGAVDISITDIFNFNDPSLNNYVLLNIRLPRLIMGLVVGASLSICGASMQGLFRNPLADPGLIGITSGATLAVGTVIVLFPTLLGGIIGLYTLSIAAFAGAMTTAIIITIIATKSNQLSIIQVLLCGIAINAIAGSLTGLLTYFSTDDQLRTLTFWTMGSISGSMWSQVIVCSTLVIPCLFIIHKCAIGLNLLSLGEESAVHTGLDYQKLKLCILITVSITVGACVAVSGFIGFIGLVVPHIIRQFIGPNHKTLLPISALLGATLLVISDLTARIIIAPAEMPVGLITSTIGGPIFLFMVIKQFSRGQ